MKLLDMQFSPVTYYFTLSHKYSQHSALIISVCSAVGISSLRDSDKYIKKETEEEEEN
jgi:hypothetical protein